MVPVSDLEQSVDELTDELRMTFRKVADVLIPRYGKMPAAGDIGIEEEALDRVLTVRSDVLPDLVRALRRLSGVEQVAEVLNVLSQDDASAFDALTLAVTGGYYTSKEVWDRLGYPGQEYLPVGSERTPEYLTNRMLERVVRRGPIYRSP